MKIVRGARAREPIHDLWGAGAGTRIRSETSRPSAAGAAAVDDVSGLPGWLRARFIVIRMTVSVCS